MDPRIEKLKDADECDTFEVNALRLNRKDLAEQARIRGLEFRAAHYGASTPVELECLKAVHAYEQTLALKNGKRTRAQRTWNMISRHGIIAAVERAVDRPHETAGFAALQEMGLSDFAFEAVILRFPEVFTPAVVERSRRRMDEYRNLSS